jgi:acyl-CoA thioester hydrolase
MHSLTLRVYYEDTDLAGIVYYANYLRFIERGRSEWVRERGIDQVRMKAEEGIVFAVTRVEADYLSPARFDDLLTIETDVIRRTSARLVFRQVVRREDTVLFRADVTVAVLGPEGRPTRLPATFPAQ